jgi:uncharacterized glyoxalase superfamily protein PhnB
MRVQQFEIILYVKDQKRSRDFYSAIFQKQPGLDVPGMTEFMLTENVKLGLMPESRIAKILSGKTPHPSEGNGIPRCELYLHIDNIEAAFNLAIKAGAKEINPIQERDWGDTVGYLTDYDGHVIAFAKSTPVKKN